VLGKILGPIFSTPRKYNGIAGSELGQSSIVERNVLMQMNMVQQIISSSVARPRCSKPRSAGQSIDNQRQIKLHYASGNRLASALDRCSIKLQLLGDQAIQASQHPSAQ
jgi:hypothetical protein